MSLSRIDAFAKEALAKPPSDWESASFPATKHLWNDVYTEGKVREIAKIIARENSRDLLSVRLLLAYAGNEAVKTFRFVGGPALEGKKRSWSVSAIRDAKRLQVTLRRSEALTSTHALVVERDDRRVASFVTASTMQAAISELLISVDKFITIAEPASRRRQKGGADEELATLHTVYLQEAVNRMTDVFVALRGLDAVRRIADEGGVRGEYPDFIRATSLPLLSAYYPGFVDRKSKLDAQIQNAVARYRGRG